VTAVTIITTFPLYDTNLPQWRLCNIGRLKKKILQGSAGGSGFESSFSQPQHIYGDFRRPFNIRLFDFLRIPR
jgi:hypothetical protein